VASLNIPLPKLQPLELTMARLTIRLDDELHNRLVADAEAAGMPTATYVRDALVHLGGLDPFHFHARFDELHSTVIQMLAIVAGDVGQRAPANLAKGMEDARRLLLERGLVTADDLLASGGGTVS
jgi:predicted transcriptional regulator